VVAQEPRLKAVLGSSDISRETVADVVLELQRTAGADLLLLTDAQGRLVVDTSALADFGFDMTGLPVIAGALASGESAGVWTQDDRVLQVAARRVGIGEDIFGVIVLGKLYSGAIAETIRRQTGSVVAIALDGRIVTTSSADELPGLLSALPAALPSLDPGMQETTVAGHRLLIEQAPLPGYHGDKKLTFVVIRSLDEALSTLDALQRTIAGLAVAALLLAVVLAFALARRLARPIDRLVQFTGELAADKLDARADLGGPVEVAQLGAAMNAMADRIAASRKQLAAKERLEKELEIAARIQTSILPRDLAIPGFEIAARMRPASEVGGDYYDVLPAPDGCWVGIGDVAGHGLTAGVVMLMVQSLTAVLVDQNPDATPSKLIQPLNRMLFGNVRHRLAQDEHVTLTLLRIGDDGRVRFAGAHEDIIVCRAAGGPCELIPTPGTWLGVIEDIGPAAFDSELSLTPGDLMILYSDGLTEAIGDKRQQFGLKRACGIIEALRGRPVQEIVDGLFHAVDAFSLEQKDDITVVVLRYRG
jgi:sigma-B regulation protein RsbU (phosphoserine phosphatase)